MRSGAPPAREVSFASATRTVATRWAPVLTVPTRRLARGGVPAPAGRQPPVQPALVPLIVRSADGAGKTVIVHAPETWQAYNLWGGYDLYQGEDVLPQWAVAPGSRGRRTVAASYPTAATRRSSGTSPPADSC